MNRAQPYLWVFDTEVLLHAAQKVANPAHPDPTRAFCLAALKRVRRRKNARLGFTEASLDRLISGLAAQAGPDEAKAKTYEAFLGTFIEPRVEMIGGKLQDVVTNGNPDHEIALQAAAAGPAERFVTLARRNQISHPEIWKIALQPFDVLGRGGWLRPTQELQRPVAPVAIERCKSAVISGEVLLNAADSFAGRHLATCGLYGERMPHELAVMEHLSPVRRLCFTPATWEDYEQKQFNRLGKPGYDANLTGLLYRIFFEEVESRAHIVEPKPSPFVCPDERGQRELEAVAGAEAGLLVTRNQALVSMRKALSEHVSCRTPSALVHELRIPVFSRRARHDHA